MPPLKVQLSFAVCLIALLIGTVHQSAVAQVVEFPPSSHDGFILDGLVQDGFGQYGIVQDPFVQPYNPVPIQGSEFPHLNASGHGSVFPNQTLPQVWPVAPTTRPVMGHAPNFQFNNVFQVAPAVASEEQNPNTVLANVESERLERAHPAIASPLTTPNSVPTTRTSFKSFDPTSAARVLNELKEIQSTAKALMPEIADAVVSINGGSGVIVNKRGVILTASHVTKKANQVINVQLSDGRRVKARTLGTNQNTDTAAVLMLEEGPWPFIPVDSESESARKVGDWCFALGYPLSYRRDRPAALRIGRILEVGKRNLITDCPIMGGDSGGPLINLRGELIGVSSRVKTDINHNAHVPIERFIEDWKQLAASVEVERIRKNDETKAYLGIQGESDTGLVRIKRIHPDSPAEDSGLKESDVIVMLDGKRMNEFDDVLKVLKNRKAGDVIACQLNRFGSLIDIQITLGRSR